MASSILQKFRNVGRLSYILNVLARYGFKREIQQTELGDLIKSPQNNNSEHDENSILLSRPERLALAFEELGTTFIKLGQLLASREDLLPQSYVDAFKRLRDQVKPIPRSVIISIIHREYNLTQQEQIKLLDEYPLGSASIAQVHRAQFSDGRFIVLKIQKPGIEQDIKNDLAILMLVASIAETAFPELRLLRLTIIVEELKRSLNNELDYLREASNTERMRLFFKDHPHIIVPKIYHDFSTPHILCMSEIKGIKLTESEKFKNRSDLIKFAVDAFFDMTFQLGLFHGDLHPGNFILTPEGKLAILDFGLTVRLRRDLITSMAFMLTALAKRDVETCARLFIDLTENEELISDKYIEKEIAEILDSVIALPLKDLNVGNVLMKIAKVTALKQAPVERDLILFFKALIILETFGKSIDNNFQMLSLANEYAAKHSLVSFDKQWIDRHLHLLMHDSSAFIRDLPTLMRTLAKKLQSGSLGFQFKSEDITQLSRGIDRSFNQLSLAILLGSIVLGGSIATYGKQGRLYDLLASFGLVAFGFALLLGLWLIIGIIRSGRFK